MLARYVAVCLALLLFLLGISPALAEIRVTLVAQADAAEEATWQVIRNSADPAVFEQFLSSFPNGSHAADAREKLLTLEDEGEALVAPEPAPPPVDYPREVQTALAAAECYFGAIDGDWGSGSSRALERFAEAAGINVNGLSPDAGLLALLLANRGTRCSSQSAAPVKAVDLECIRTTTKLCQIDFFHTPKVCSDAASQEELCTRWPAREGDYDLVDHPDLFNCSYDIFVACEAGTAPGEVCHSDARTFTFCGVH
jgi:hypothetical protein